MDGGVSALFGIYAGLPINILIDTNKEFISQIKK